MVFGKDQVSIGRQKGTQNKKSQRFKDIVLTELIKRKKDIEDVKYVEIAKIGQAFVPKEQELRIQSEMPIIQIIGIHEFPAIKQVQGNVIDTASLVALDEDTDDTHDEQSNTQPTDEHIDDKPDENTTTDKDPTTTPPQADLGGEGVKKESLTTPTPTNLKDTKDD